jgi:hypothetical protein
MSWNINKDKNKEQPRRKGAKGNYIINNNNIKYSLGR